MMTIKQEVPLAPYTSFRIGGASRLFSAASSRWELRQALAFALQRGIPCHILGGGTNILVSDSGFDGMVVKAELAQVGVRGRTIEAEAGVELMHLVERAAAQGLAGMERLAGIPGTVGGAVRGNAGAYGTSIGEMVREVTVLDLETLEFLRLGAAECHFGYRTSLFKERGGLIVVSASLELSPAPCGQIAEKVQETLAKRLAKNLQAELSVGSFFMNPVVTDQRVVQAFERERQTHCRDGRVPAGWLIERAALRNRRVGGAMISERHANYIINTGNASARDVRELAATVQQEVAQKTGVVLQEEACYLGF